MDLLNDPDIISFRSTRIKWIISKVNDAATGETFGAALEPATVQGAEAAINRSAKAQAAWKSKTAPELRADVLLAWYQPPHA